MQQPAPSAVPDPAPLAALDPQQRAVARAVLGGRDALVIGGPGTGKTRTAAAIAQALGADDRVLVLCASRQRAAEFNAGLAAAGRTVRSGPVARTPAALAFAVLTERALRDPEARLPRLLSGSEEDRIFAELLAGERTPEAPSAPWPATIPAETRALRGFRTELRDLFMRCTEYDVGPVRLHQLADLTGRAEWHAAADFFRTYTTVKAATFRYGQAFDSSELLARAAEQLRVETPAPLASVRWVIVDDAQDATPATAQLLAALIGPGCAVAGFGDPDTAVNGFRGGVPASATQLLSAAGRSPQRFILTGSHRLRGDLLAVSRGLADGIGVVGEARQRMLHPELAAESAAADRTAATGPDARADASGPTDAGGVETWAASGASAAASGIAGRLRARHLLQHLSWNDMAVVLRSGDGLPQLAEALEEAGVPVTVAGVERPLRDHPIVRELLQWLQAAAGTGPLGADEFVELLTGEVVGLDALGVRRLRHELREAEFVAGGSRRSRELLALGCAQPSAFTDLSTPEGEAAAGAARLLARLRDQLAAGVSAAQALWIVWQAARGRRGVHPGRDARRSAFGAALQQQALSTGPGASAAASTLDAALALFAAADRFTERFPRSGAGAFVESVLGQSVPEDTLALHEHSEAVVLATPAAVAGREFAYVVVAGLQEGLWPNLRVRGTLLGAPQLEDALLGSVDVDHRRAVLDDELRFYYTAMTRSRGDVLVVATETADDAPSSFFVATAALAAPPAPADPVAARALQLAAAAPLTLRGLVASLRRELAADPAAPGSGEAAGVLRRLAAAGVAPADPGHWAGLRPLIGAGTHPTVLRDGEAVVSPSALERFERDPADWFLGSIGARPSGTAQGVGTIVHAALQRSAEDDDISLGALTDHVRQRWGELEFPVGWEGDLEWQRVGQMLQRLHGYLRAAAADGWAPIGAEIGFETRLPGVDIHGFIDRVERNGAGEVRIVDLKTGANVITVAEATANLQLAAYQIALPGLDLGTGPVSLSESFLLFVAGDGQRAAIRTQAPHTPLQRAEFTTRIETIGAGMAAGAYPVGAADGFRTRDSQLLAIPEVTE
jgi:superfamily I DNA/RNA helicase/RecB family exonuclease